MARKEKVEEKVRAEMKSFLLWCAKGNFISNKEYKSETQVYQDIKDKARGTIDKIKSMQGKVK